MRYYLRKCFIVFRYSAINEINKSKQEEIEGKVFVYFITKLLRLDSGTSFVGFCGGEMILSIQI